MQNKDWKADSGSYPLETDAIDKDSLIAQNKTSAEGTDMNDKDVAFDALEHELGTDLEIKSSNEQEDVITRFKKAAIETLTYIVVSIIIIMCFKTFVVQHVRVDGESMLPTLENNEHLLIDKISYQFGEIERFDIIVFRPYENEKKVFYVKRVIGLPNDRIQIKNGVIYINGSPLTENYGGLAFTESKNVENEIQLGEDEYFVLGDNRAISKDSRDPEVGPVKKDAIVGKAWYVIYPFSRFGLIKH